LADVSLRPVGTLLILLTLLSCFPDLITSGSKGIRKIWNMELRRRRRKKEEREK
jgi:hypothetical protein